MQKITYLLVLALFALVSCNNSSSTQNEAAHNDTDGHHHEKEDMATEAHNHADHDHGNATEKDDRQITATAQKNGETSAIIDAYIAIKNALVADDKKGAAEGSKALLDAFTSFDMKKLSVEQHKEYMEILENAKEQAEHIVKSPIDHQREHFETLSTDINDLIALVGTDKTLYEDFCPMANDGKGAIWLSEIKDIKNPFYGSKMLKCGKVQKQIN